MNEIEHEAGLAPTPGYRYAERVGSRLHIAGQVPLDGDGTLVGGGDVGQQAVQCLANLEVLVQAHGFERRHIRQLTVYVVGPQPNLTDAWRAVARTFGGEVPPATLLGVHLLGYEGQLVEIDATIERDD
jgi:enamine deaminase RidA (YjgF/YER057c/UK114 family)